MESGSKLHLLGRQRKSFSVIDYKDRMWVIGGDTTAYKFGTEDVWNSKGANR